MRTNQIQAEELIKKSQKDKKYKPQPCSSLLPKYISRTNNPAKHMNF